MKTVAIYNMKGGVGKTTSAVNLSYLAAASGARTLLWDLDPQGAATFAFRVQPHVEGFGKQSLEDGHALGAAIRETDYNNLHLLPADFAYRKFERLLDSIGKPERLVTSLLETLGRDFDMVFLDCPAGFSLLIEGIFAAADAIIVPTIPTVLSLRTLAQLIKWADRSEARCNVAAFFSMVDRRKTLHRHATEWSVAHPQIFMRTHIPYASIVEQMTVRRMPLATFAARESATEAFAKVWEELDTRLQGETSPAGQKDTWSQMLKAVESLVGRLESANGPSETPTPSDQGSRAAHDVHVVHRFDTEQQDLERSGHVLELRELSGKVFVVSARSGSDEAAGANEQAYARIDSSWAVQILSGEMSPLDALERRLGRPGPPPLEHIHQEIGGRKLRRTDTRIATGEVLRTWPPPVAYLAARLPNVSIT
ncbi:MAG TPA: AAA family ATPase [Vicinamibacterales bacterium]|nr:AAA family ATPase [Vicinamibacterales bacterium]